MKRLLTAVVIFLATIVLRAGSPDALYSLVERIAPGRSADFTFLVEPSEGEARYFEVAADTLAPGKVMIKGNDNSSLAIGLHYYLKRYTANHLSWDDMTVTLPKELPLPREAERRVNATPFTYYLNYCTYSYSMPFWDEERWMKEIDWMALHGVNMPLALIGTDVVWRNTLIRLGYTPEEADSFIAGPAFQAWWLMNNLEGWGGPLSSDWYERSEKLQRHIIARMRELDIEPVLTGYSGMVPHDAAQRLSLNVSDPGLWCAFRRPAFLQPSDSRFDEIADIYYDEMNRLYGTSRYYSMDPFHEGGSTAGVDLGKAARSIVNAMRRAAPESVWILQGWQENPRRELLMGLNPGEAIVLDLSSESVPHWGDPLGREAYRSGFSNSPDWLFCMLLNYGGNVGLHGKLHAMPEAFARALEYGGENLRGVGMTMEGIENNPVMYEMLSELPWLNQPVDPEQWLRGYLKARYGGVDTPDSALVNAWLDLGRTIYNCPRESHQQGTSESIFCVRPHIGAKGASAWVNDSRYYDRREVANICHNFELAVERIDPAQRNRHLLYDLTDIVRQGITEQGWLLYDSICNAFKAADRKQLQALSAKFMTLIERQDSLLASEPFFTLDRWMETARRAGKSDAEKRAFMAQALRQITTWGPREASERGSLHDYAHKEWSGLLNNYYAPRWQHWFDWLDSTLAGESPSEIDWFAFEDQLIESILAKY